MLRDGIYDAKTTRTLTGPEKVGVLLLALGKERASGLLKRFDPAELNTIVRSTEVMPTISASELESIVEEFESQLGLGTPFVGRPEDVKRLLTDAITEKKSSADADGEFVERQDIWTRLAGLGDDILIPYFGKQSPQIVAYYLDRLGTERASTLLKSFDPAVRNDLLIRILSLGQLSPQVVEALESSLHEELFDVDRPSRERHLAIAGILNNLDAEDSVKALEFLSTLRPSDAQVIRKMLFKFEGLAKLPQKALTVVMDGVPVERTVLALQKCEPELQEKVLSALSPRARRMAEAELQSPANVPPRNVTDARRAIVDMVLKLAAEGTIELPDPSAEQAQ